MHHGGQTIVAILSYPGFCMYWLYSGLAGSMPVCAEVLRLILLDGHCSMVIALLFTSTNDITADVHLSATAKLHMIVERSVAAASAVSQWAPILLTWGWRIYRRCAAFVE